MALTEAVSFPNVATKALGSGPTNNPRNWTTVRPYTALVEDDLRDSVGAFCLDCPTYSCNVTWELSRDLILY